MRAVGARRGSLFPYFLFPTNYYADYSCDWMGGPVLSQVAAHLSPYTMKVGSEQLEKWLEKESACSPRVSQISAACVAGSPMHGRGASRWKDAGEVMVVGRA
ncbi:hypothetical protein TraAM80_05115 [Trypanosoma rangeli]|uniref:Uncharacterized protein n=1 Tax=Trypanosoma rangeli TaxID=5698 RepID=A0A3R7MEU0_TRYRA|nr:uncharacterized protein TraAM80_05115 [Trypanosoma rangeli]RNF04523.1 hypothetical protein TraAM80_05115 [Trypanosoma rangeli]|eukprot:RNF04523.1 hypothetical protein TraAM80_05115 [Trypanosoma rangeli]